MMELPIAEVPAKTGTRPEVPPLVVTVVVAAGVTAGLTFVFAASCPNPLQAGKRIALARNTRAPSRVIADRESIIFFLLRFLARRAGRQTRHSPRSARHSTAGGGKYSGDISPYY